MTRLIQVIETDLELRGKGVPDDPVRRVTQYYSTEGVWLAERDTWLLEQQVSPSHGAFHQPKA